VRNKLNLKKDIYLKISNLSERPNVIIDDDHSLIGSDSTLDSMKLVELCIYLEDMASEIGFDFDWTSESAMSRSRSIFKTAGSLTIEFFEQMESK